MGDKLWYFHSLYTVNIYINWTFLLQGTLKGFDQTINLVIDDCQERVYNSITGIEQVPLGLYIMRGDNV